MLPLLPWGLPTARNDVYLFDDGSAWPAEEYKAARALRELSERNAGADTDLDPIQNRGGIVELTSDAAQRGEIMLRYRLYSHQPDEMITFRALQRMKPRQFDFDPRLYQYGGGYIYLVGAALGAATLTGFAQITSDLDTYLVAPDLFGRFYVVARLISVAFAALGLVAAFHLAATVGGRRAGWASFLLIAFSPVFLCGALEAKPHLPAAAFGLWVAVFALRASTRHCWSNTIKLGLLAGYSMSLVLTGVASLLTILAAAAIGSARNKMKLAPFGWAFATAIAVYCLTNPFVLFNAFNNPTALTSNMSNSTAMYSIARLGDGIQRMASLLVEGIGWAALAVGLVGTAVLFATRPGKTTIGAAAGLGLLMLCSAIGAEKPAEFARFLVLPAGLLCIAAAVAIARIAQTSQLLAMALLATSLFFGGGWNYCASFWQDGLGRAGTRTLSADWLARRAASTDSIGLLQEPAPYCVPPLNFESRRIFLLPTSPPPEIATQSLPTWLVGAVDAGLREGKKSAWEQYYELAARFPIGTTRSQSPITWANKPILIYRLKNERAINSRGP